LSSLLLRQLATTTVALQNVSNESLLNKCFLPCLDFVSRLLSLRVWLGRGVDHHNVSLCLLLYFLRKKVFITKNLLSMLFELSVVEKFVYFSSWIRSVCNKEF
jgi:hypothetical protein